MLVEEASIAVVCAPKRAKFWYVVGLKTEPYDQLATDL